MFMWMFIEGLYLHNVVTVSVFQGRFPHITYVSIGTDKNQKKKKFFAKVLCSIFLIKFFKDGASLH